MKKSNRKNERKERKTTPPPHKKKNRRTNIFFACNFAGGKGSETPKNPRRRPWARPRSHQCDCLRRCRRRRWLSHLRDAWEDQKSPKSLVPERVVTCNEHGASGTWNPWLCLPCLGFVCFKYTFFCSSVLRSGLLHRALSLFSGSFASWRIFFVFYFQFLFSSTNLRCSYASFYIDRFGTRRDSPRRNTFPNKQKKWHFQVFLKWFSSLRGRRGGSIFERIKRNAQLLKINFTHFSGGISNWSSEIGKKKIRNISFQIVISSSGGGRVKFWWFFKCGIAFIFRTKFAFCWFFPSRTCFDWEFIFKKK